MKFQNPILNFEQKDGRMEGRTSPKQYAPSFFFKVGGIIKKNQHQNS